MQSRHGMRNNSPRPKKLYVNICFGEINNNEVYLHYSHKTNILLRLAVLALEFQTKYKVPTLFMILPKISQEKLETARRDIDND